MKTLFIPLLRRNIYFNKKILNKFVDEIGSKENIDIFYTIQYKKLAEAVKKYLGLKSEIKQVLGCSLIKTKKNVLLICDGKFHALNIAINSKKEIYFFNGYCIEKISYDEISHYENNKKAKIKKFFLCDKIGIIVSIKKYQNKLDYALLLKNKIEKLGKKVYILICDNVTKEEIENFSLPLYINTACPGLDKDDKKILNYLDILEFLK
ncbi:MAG: diphthamide synthesis protein [Candidatus Pacearchaeota archaeon]